MTGLVVYVYSFVVILRKMAVNSRVSKLSEKEDEYIFSWKLFSSWDFMIGNAETAHNRVAAIVIGFREALLEEAEKKKDTNWKIITVRVLVNVTVFALLVLSALAVVEVVKRSTEPEAKSNIWRMNEITIVMTSISTCFPMLFEGLGIVEKYHPRKQLRLQLARIMLLNLLNIYSLIFALFDKISDMQVEQESFKMNMTAQHEMGFPKSHQLAPNLNWSKCRESHPTNLESANLISAVLANISYISLKIYRDNDTKFLDITEFWQNFTASKQNWILNRNETLSHNDSGNYNLTGNNESVADLQDVFGESFEDMWARFQENGTKLLDEYYNETSIESTSLFYNFTELKAGTANEPYGNVTQESPEENSSNSTYFELYGNIFEDNTTATLFFSESSVITDPLPVSSTETDFIDSLENSTSVLHTEIYDEIKSTISSLLNITQDEFEVNFGTKSHPSILNITSTLATFNETKTNCSRFKSNLSHPLNTSLYFNSMDYKSRSKLRSLCWETMFGQEIVKLTVMDFIMTIISTLAMDFFRGIFVRVMNNCWCWDLEKKFPQYGDFKVAENILHLINNQGMVWMGMFFSPGLVVLNVFKLYAMVYFRSWTVLTCNVPHKVVFRASRSNNFYYALLLSMLFLCVLPVGYAIVWVQPSWHCGPFSNYQMIFHIFTKTLKRLLPKSSHKILDYIASPGIVIPLLVLMILIIYYLISLSTALREANDDLKVQLRRERTEERRKMFKMVDRRRRVGSEGSGELGQIVLGRWKKLLQTLPSGKSFDDTIKQETSGTLPNQSDASKTKDFLSNFIKRALNKPSEDDNNQDDATDTEQHDSLPDDITSVKDIKPQSTRKPNYSFVKTDLNFSFKRAVDISNQLKGRTFDAGKTQKTSTDSGEKRVKILDEFAPISRATQRVRKDSLDLINTQSKRRVVRSPSKASSSSKMREDSVTSTWSDNIPVIKISKTESSECILDDEQVVGQSNRTISRANQENVLENVAVDDVGEDVCAPSSSEVPTREFVNVKNKNKHVLKKQQVTEDENVVGDRNVEEENSRDDADVEDRGTRSTNTENVSNFDTKTESSVEYKSSDAN